ncbi:protein ROOT INITIATION DEFECTIVE 3-like [Cynara cardunculus var. scolymus]|uniref:protein ROOT INITIATION DEFECTIVE 3-like n=1 Tax=Cynara cardunculus var. scolymus TaxID=59895 RepID=UPI000D6313CE|nr:protein ROOT INITIATION DEFECTIVE 3-like [Cynara cardunculus var. scolymus]
MLSSINDRRHDFGSMSSPPPLPEIVLIASPDGPLTAYDPYSGTVLARFNGSRCPRNGIAIVGKDLFAVSHVSPETGAGSVRFYYWWSPSCTQNVPLPEPVAPLAATVDGSYLFAGGISGRIHAVSVPSGVVIRSFSAHEKPVTCFARNFDGSLILSGSDDGTIAVLPIFLLLDASFDTESRYSNFNRLIGHESSVTGLTAGIGSSGSIMISSSLDWTCKIWSLVSGIHLQTVKFPSPVWCTALDPSETELYASGTDGVIYKRRLKVATRKQVAKGGETVVWGGVHGGGVVAMEMLNYGRTLLTVCENGGICVWEVEGGKMISGFGEKIGGVSGVVVARGGGGFGKRGEWGGYWGGKELGKAVTAVAEMEEVLKVVAEDRRRAISNLESAIEMNERLLKLMLREAKTIAKFDQSNRNINILNNK